MASQNVLNLVDTAMVGVLGDRALAAVGIAGFANFMATAFITGMSAGVQAMSARWLGAGRHGETAVPLNGGLLLAVVLGLPLTVVLVAAVPHAFPFLVSDPEVARMGGDYLTVRLLAMTAVGMNYAFRGYWNAVDLSRLYMGTLVLMHATNIFANWVLIFGHLGVPALGVRGAAIGTAASTVLGTVCYFALALRHARGAGFLSALPSREAMTAMLRTSLPAGTQQFFFAAGMTGFFWILGRIGTSELAAGNVLVNVMLVAILPSLGFGLAAATLVGQALGAGDRGEAHAWGWRVGQVNFVAILLLVLPAILWPDLVLGVFLHDPATLALARLPLRLAAAAAPLESLGAVLMNAHLGAGSSRRVLWVSIATQWGFLLPLAWLVGPGLGMGLLAVWLVQILYRLLSMVVFTWSWRQGQWASIRL